MADKEAAGRLFAHLWRGGAWAYYWTDTDKESLWFPVGRAPGVPASWLNQNCYFGVHPCGAKYRSDERSKIATVTAVNCLFSEYDAKDFPGGKPAILARLKELPIFPSAVFDSGGGYHCYWFLRDTVTVNDGNRADMVALQAAWVTLTGGDKPAKDLARVLRVPGTRNMKPEYGPDFPTVALVQWTGVLYDLADFELLTAGLVAVKAPGTNGAAHFQPSTWGGSDLETVAAALNFVNPWAIDYAEWVAVLMAIHAEFGMTGLSMAAAWADGKDGEVESKFLSFKPSGNGSGRVTLGTVFHLAEKHGWQRPQAAVHLAPVDAAPWPEVFEEPADFGADVPAAAIPTAGGDVLLTEGADDDGNSRCVAALYPGQFLHCDALGWLAWDGVKWGSGAESVLDEAIKATLKTRRLAAVAAEREAIVKAATPSARRVRDARFMLGSLLSAPVESFDGPAHLLNCQNGVVNLATGELVAHDPRAHRFTYAVNAEYNPKADRGEWLAFLRQTIGADDDMLRFVQMAVGYSLTGETQEESLFYVHGPARSGKGTFAETLLALLGAPLALAADFSTFTEQKNDVQNFALAALRPARLVIASESERYTALNPAKIKNLTGGDSITAAHKFKDAFTFRPRFKMWLFSNWPVNVDVDDDAAWYRLRVIPFPNSHAGKEDKSLKARLRSGPALSGVLAWAVKGAKMWYALGSRGLVTPEAIDKATRAQRDALDFVQSWLDETCVMGPGLWVSNELLYQSYGAWCKANGVSPKGQKTLAQSLQAKGLTTGAQKKVSGVNHKGVEGLDLAIRQAT
jgi:putative DNA primase/helicase